MIAAEALDEMSVALNKDDRATLNQELYDEVMALARLNLAQGRNGQRYSGQRPQPCVRRTRASWS